MPLSHLSFGASGLRSLPSGRRGKAPTGTSSQPFHSWQAPLLGFLLREQGHSQQQQGPEFIPAARRHTAPWEGSLRQGAGWL